MIDFEFGINLQLKSNIVLIDVFRFEFFLTGNTKFVELNISSFIRAWPFSLMQKSRCKKNARIIGD